MDVSATVAVGAGLVGTTLSLWMIVPQTVRVWARRSADGVSAGTWTLFFCSFALWVGYAWRVENRINFGCNLATSLIGGTLLLGLARARAVPYARRAGLITGAVCLWAVLFLAGLMAPVAVIASVLVAGSLVRAPQVTRSFRTYRAASPSDVSMLTWWMAVISSVFWFVHGVTLPDHLITATTAGSIVLSGVVLALEYGAAARRTAAPELDAAAVV